MIFKLNVRRAALLLALMSAALPAAAQLLGTTARQQPSGSLKLSVYYDGVVDQSVNFSIVGADTCTAAPPNGGVSFACGKSGRVEGNGFGRAGMFKLAGQMGDYVQPYVVFGSGDYELSVPSTTIANKLTGSKMGLIYGGGIKFSLVPDTQRDIALALDLGLVRSVYDFNRVAPGGAPGVGSIDQRLVLTAYQAAIETSHLFAVGRGHKLEPYGGVKWVRVEADLKDSVSGEHAGGKTDTVSPFIGLRVPATWGESVGSFVEAAFVDGYRYGAGFDWRFK